MHHFKTFEKKSQNFSQKGHNELGAMQEYVSLDPGGRP